MFTSACGVLPPHPHPHPHTINILYAYALYTDYRVAILVLYCVHMEGSCVVRTPLAKSSQDDVEVT